MANPPIPSPVYQGQFGTFTINEHDRREVIIYRTGLAIAASSFVVGAGTVLLLPQQPFALMLASVCFWGMIVGLGISLWTIHIYLKPLHRALQLFWGIGVITAAILTIGTPLPLVQVVYENPLTLLGIGFLFAALTGIYFKEAFCFNRLETKFLTPLVPGLLLGHLFGVLPLSIGKVGLEAWAVLFLVFAIRKSIQPIPPDIGDKSVFEHLKLAEKVK